MRRTRTWRHQEAADVDTSPERLNLVALQVYINIRGRARTLIAHQHRLLPSLQLPQNLAFTRAPLHHEVHPHRHASLWSSRTSGTYGH